MPDRTLVDGKFTTVIERSKTKGLFLVIFKEDHFLNPTHAAEEIREEWIALFNGDNKSIMVDISAITQPISMLAGLFLWAHAEATERKSTFVLFNPQKATTKMFKLCGLSEIITVYPNLKKAQMALLQGDTKSPSKGFFSFLSR